MGLLASAFTSRKPSPGELVRAVREADSAAVRNLLAQGADPNDKDATHTALSYAAYYGTLEMVQILIDKGADVNRANPRGETPLMTAASSYSTYNASQRDAILRLLIAKGANLAARNNEGYTALQLATSRGRPAAVEIIKEALAQQQRDAAARAKAEEERKRQLLAEKQKKLQDKARKPIINPFRGGKFPRFKF